MDAVFHTVSVIDLAPFPSGGMEGVNVKGTKNIIEVCQEKNVQYLIYTRFVVIFVIEGGERKKNILLILVKNKK